MRLVECTSRGARPFVLAFHPRVTVVTGLTADERVALVDRLAGLLAGREVDDLGLTVELDGAVLLLDGDVRDALAALPPIDVVLRAEHLPVRQDAGSASESPPSRAPEPDAETAARAADAAARRRDAETALAAAQAELDRLSTDELPEAEAAGRAAEQRVADARRALDAVVERDRERGRQPEVAAALSPDGAAADTSSQPSQAAVEAVRAALAVCEAPSTPAERASHASQLADHWARIERRLRSIEVEAEEHSPALAKAHEAVLRARAEVADAERAARPQGPDPGALADLERCHAAVLEAEERTRRRFGGGAARARLEQARRAEADVLARLGLSSYAEYLVGVSTTAPDPGAAQRLTDARATLTAAEAEWKALEARLDTPERRALLGEQAQLRERAVALLGEDPGDRLEAALRAHESAAGVETARAPLVEALTAVGVEPVGDAVDAARAWLHDVDAAERAPSAAPAQPAPEAAEPAQPAPEAGETGEAEAALAEASTLAEAAAAALADVRERLAAAEQEVVAATADLRAAVDAAQEAAGSVVTTAPPAASASDGLAAIDAEALDIYLLSRLASLRHVGRVGALPLLIDAALLEATEETRRRALAQLERFSDVVQIVFFTEVPSVDEWAVALGPENAAVRRFTAVGSTA